MVYETYEILISHSELKQFICVILFLYVKYMRNYMSIFLGVCHHLYMELKCFRVEWKMKDVLQFYNTS